MDDTVRESEHLLLAALEGIAEGVLILDSEHHVRYINPAATALLGLCDKPPPAQHWRVAFDAAGTFGRDIPTCIDGGPLHGSYSIATRDTGVVTLEVKPLQTVLGGTLIAVRSNASLAAIELEPAPSREQLEVTFKRGRIGLWEWEPRGDRLTLSREWYALFEYPQGSISTMLSGLHELLHPEDVAPGHAALLPLLRGSGEDFEIEQRCRHSDGHYIHVLSRGHVLERDGKGEAARVIGTHVDITSLKNTEQRMRKSTRLLETVIDAFPHRIFWRDLDNRYLGANRQFARDAAVADPKELIGRDATTLNWPSSIEAPFDDDRRPIESSETKLVTRRPLTTLAGREFWAETIRVPIRAQDGQVLGVLGIYDDISERIAQERQMEIIAEAFTEVEGTRLLDSLAAAAAKLAGADLAYCARFEDGEPARVRVTGCFPLDAPLRQMSYDLEDTPCETATSAGNCIISENIAAKFPRDVILHELAIEAYAGQLLRAADGRVVGLFVMLFRHALKDKKSVQAVIDIFSARATAELERELAHTELHASEQRLNAAIEGGSQAIWEWFPTSDRMKVYGPAYENLPVASGNAMFERMHPDDRGRQRSALQLYFSGERESYEYEGRILAPNNEYRWYLTRGRATQFDADGQVIKLVGTVTDITASKSVQFQLEQARQFLNLVIDTVPQAVFWQDTSFRYLGCNQRFADLAGVISPTALLECQDADLWWGEDAKRYREEDRRLLAGEISIVRVEAAVKTPGREKIWIDLIKVPMRGPDGTIVGILGAIHDVTSRKNAETAAQHLARFDPLTNLPNRRYFAERLEASMAALARRRRKGALLFIDLDQFKHINDSLGHSVGDALLQAVAQRLQNATRQEDTVARLGGDEFVVLVADIADDIETSARHAQTMADKVHASLARPYQLDRHQLHVTPTIGITLFPESGKSVDDVLKEADTAMYSGKAAGRNVTRFFRREMEEAAQLRLNIESDLRKAIVNNEFELYFQPQVDRSGDVTGAEVLLRWHHSERGLVPPGVFIPIAEERGLIVDIGRWILDTSFGYLHKWIEQDIAVGELAINVSSHQFRSEDFYADVERLLARHQIPPQRVVFEITEGTVVEDVEATIAIMQRLRHLGIRFAIDDFGVGYSSLSYLKRLPIDQLKIDRSFITDIGKDENDEVICETIVAMSQHLRLETIAEGVESQEQYNFLMRLRCSGYQGYMFLPPSPEQTFLQYCAHRRA